MSIEIREEWKVIENARSSYIEKEKLKFKKLVLGRTYIYEDKKYRVNKIEFDFTRGIAFASVTCLKTYFTTYFTEEMLDDIQEII